MTDSRKTDRPEVKPRTRCECRDHACAERNSAARRGGHRSPETGGWILGPCPREATRYVLVLSASSGNTENMALCDHCTPPDRSARCACTSHSCGSDHGADENKRPIHCMRDAVRMVTVPFDKGTHGHSLGEMRNVPMCSACASYHEKRDK